MLRVCAGIYLNAHIVMHSSALKTYTGCTDFGSLLLFFCSLTVVKIISGKIMHISKNCSHVQSTALLYFFLNKCFYRTQHIMPYRNNSVKQNRLEEEVAKTTHVQKVTSGTRHVSPPMIEIRLHL